MVTERGGTGIAKYVDHGDMEQVREFKNDYLVFLIAKCSWKKLGIARLLTFFAVKLFVSGEAALLGG